MPRFTLPVRANRVWPIALTRGGIGAVVGVSMIYLGLKLRGAVTGEVILLIVGGLAAVMGVYLLFAQGLEISVSLVCDGGHPCRVGGVAG